MTIRGMKNLKRLMECGGERTRSRRDYKDPDVQDCLRSGLTTWRKSSNQYSVETITDEGRKALS